ncbi:MAG: efflux RND transporter permease subunit [Chromatiales bacterium]|nr:MAG: efflux RND transporter permease subunit [Chromatiales bacterium]
MNALIDLCVSRSRAVMVALAVLLFAGAAAYRGVPKEAQPDVNFPFISIEVMLEGVAAEDSERLLVRPLEQQLRNLEGVKEMISSATENRASVTLEFNPDVDVDEALIDVRERVDQAKAELPEDAREPSVSEVKFSKFDPMLVINLGGNLPERTMNFVARALQDRLQSVDGVLEVNMVGIRTEILEIIVNPLILESYGLSPADVLNFVQRNNRLVAAGSLQSERGRFAVKVPGVIESPEDVLSLPIKVDGNRVVHFRDIAQVRRTFKDPESFARLNGEPAVGIRVVQRNGSNVLNVVDAAKIVVADAQKTWPPGITLTYSRDKSEQVRADISQLVNDVVVAVLLVVICLIGILGFQNALLAGISIPGSFAAAFILISATGMTMNMVVFFGLIMSVGLVVDGAIVVVELADRRMAEGLDRRVAYAEAAKRMAWPIFASIAATVVAFVPLVFWPGIIGDFLSYMPIVLVYTLSASLVIAMFVVPALGSIFGRGGHLTPESRRQLGIAETGDLNQLTGWTGRYLLVVTAAISRPWITAGSVTLLLLAVFATYSVLGGGVTLFPAVDPMQGSVDVRARGDLSTHEKDQLVRLVEERIYGVPGIKHIYASSGSGNRGAAPDQIGSISLNFQDWRERPPATEIVAEIRRRTADIAGIVIEPRLREEGPIQGKPLNIEASSQSLDALRDAVGKLREFVETIPGVINAEDTSPLPGIEWRMQVDRAQAAKFGADVALVGNIVQLVTNGIKLGTYRPDDSDEELDIRVRFPADDRSLDKLAELRIPTRTGNVPMGSFVTREPAEATRTIMRTDMQRTMLVQADLEKGVLIEPVLDQVRAALPSLDLDPSVALRFKGGAQNQKETADFLAKAFLVGLGLIALILVAEFNSLFQPLLVLTAVVFSTGGVLLGLLVTGRPFSLVNCGIGTIALAGIIVNNNIVLIDTYNKLREAGMAAHEAILRTGAQRLRPVLLTKVVMILGLMPMALSLNIDILERKIYFGGPGSQWWAEMATVIIGGLIFASILTLILTPSILMIEARIGAWFAARRAPADAPVGAAVGAASAATATNLGRNGRA